MGALPAQLEQEWCVDCVRNSDKRFERRYADAQAQKTRQDSSGSVALDVSEASGQLT